MSHSSTPYDIVGEMFQLLCISCETFTYPPTTLKQSYFAGPCTLDKPCFHVVSVYLKDKKEGKEDLMSGSNYSDQSLNFLPHAKNIH